MKVNGLVIAQERETANTLEAPADLAGPAATLADVKWLIGHWGQWNAYASEALSLFRSPFRPGRRCYQPDP
jgi:hypothetical protein